MKLPILWLLVGMSLMPFAANADIAPDPGYHAFSTHAEFDNLADYPAYDVYVSHDWRFGPSPVLARGVAAPTISDIETAYKTSDLPPFFAVRESDQAKITHKTDEERGDVWATLPENKKYLIDASVTGKGASLDSQLVGGFLPDSNPAAYIVWVYHIDRLTDSSFTAHFVSESRYDIHAQLVSGPALPKSGSTGTTAEPTVVANPNEVTPISTWAPSGIAPESTTPIWIAIIFLGAGFLALAVKTWKK